MHDYFGLWVFLHSVINILKQNPKQMGDPGKKNDITVGLSHGKVREPPPTLMHMLQWAGGYCCLLDRSSTAALLGTPEGSCPERYLRSCAKMLFLQPEELILTVASPDAEEAESRAVCIKVEPGLRSWSKNMLKRPLVCSLFLQNVTRGWTCTSTGHQTVWGN